jgi:hypothetical protein
MNGSAIAELLEHAIILVGKINSNAVYVLNMEMCSVLLSLHKRILGKLKKNVQGHLRAVFQIWSDAGLHHNILIDNH